MRCAVQSFRFHQLQQPDWEHRRRIFPLYIWCRKQWTNVMGTVHQRQRASVINVPFLRQTAPLFVEDVTVDCPRRTVVRTVDARPCVQRRSLTNQHCTRHVQSSCVSNMACSIKPAVTEVSFPTSSMATRCSSAIWFRQVTRATPNWCSLRAADHGCSRPHVSKRAVSSCIFWCTPGSPTCQLPG